MNRNITKKAKSEITYSKMFWIFLLGSIAGFVLEGLWCIFKTGTWESHSSTIIGPFCIIYGFGAVVVYLISIRIKSRGLPLQFILFSVAAAIVEYFGSLFQQIVFGSVSWDYSDHFMNISGRVSLRMALIWGVLGIFFVRFLFPVLVRFFGKIRHRIWKVVCTLLSVFMAVNLFLSATAIIRWRERVTKNILPDNAFEQFLDETYDNETMKQNYPNMKFMAEYFVNGDFYPKSEQETLISIQQMNMSVIKEPDAKTQSR